MSLNASVDQSMLMGKWDVVIILPDAVNDSLPRKIYTFELAWQICKTSNHLRTLNVITQQLIKVNFNTSFS